MAENENGQEKTEQPTEKRRREAREKGDIARSRELNTVIGVLAAGAGLLILGEALMSDLMTTFAAGLTVDPALLGSDTYLTSAFSELGVHAIKALAPLMLLMVVAALLGPVFMGGIVFRPASIAPKPEKLDPIKGLGRIFSANGALELMKALFKFLLVTTAGAIFLSLVVEDLLALGMMPIMTSLVEAGWLMITCFLVLGSTLILIAVVDVPFQLWEYDRKLRMTRKEVKDEMKETEGSPELKARVRSLQMEISQRHMMEAVKEADVVVRNPTHFAVALKYDETMSAPRVVAKGKDLVAERIIEVAGEAGVATLRLPPLARVLFATTEIDSEIPVRLYEAVAELLAFIYRLDTDAGAGLALTDAPDIQVPADMLTSADADLAINDNRINGDRHE